MKPPLQLFDSNVNSLFRNALRILGKNKEPPKPIIPSKCNPIVIINIHILFV